MLLRSLPSSLQPVSNGLFSPNPPSISPPLPCSMFNQQVSNISLSQTLNDTREEEPCTPCTLWLSSLTSLQQLSLSTAESSNPNQHNDLDDSNNTPSTSSHIPAKFQEITSTKSPVELFQEEFQLRCGKSLKTSTTTSSPNLNARSSSPHSLLQSNSFSIDASTNNIISKVLTSAVVKKTQLKQNKILKQRNKMSIGITNIIIPKQQTSPNNASLCIKSSQNK